MKDDAVIILDPVNRDVIDAALAKRHQELHRRQLHGQPDDDGARRAVPARPGRVDDLHDLPGGVGRRRAEHARAAACRWARRISPRSSCSRIRRRRSSTSIAKSPASCATSAFPTEHFGVPLAGSLIPWIDKDLGDGMSREEWKGGAETNKILGRARTASAIPVDSICVRIGAMRCHSQALTIKLTRDMPLAEIEAMLAGAQRMGARRSQHARRQASASSRPPRSPDRSEVPIGRLRKLAMGGEYLGAFTVGDQLLWGAAEPLRRMLRILLATLMRRLLRRAVALGASAAVC